MDEPTETKLKTCDIKSCQGMCCYDGAYLLMGEEEYIKAIVSKYPDDFADIPEGFIVDGYWQGAYFGRKTSTRPFDYETADFPQHFESTRCVFADETGYCRLEKLARRLGIHKWTFKPSVCWLFPLRINHGNVQPPPAKHDQDPERLGESYPGFTTYARCGRHRDDGASWQDVLAEELQYFDRTQSIPKWSLEQATLNEIIEMAKLK